MFPSLATALIILFQKVLTQGTIGTYYEWLQNSSVYEDRSKELIGHSFKSLDTILVTQCSLACLKESRCLSYNFDSMAKRCHLNEATHLSQPSSLQPSSSSQYFLRDFYTIDKKSDPCLSLPCSNNGTCLSRSGNVFFCLCPAQWSGTYCSDKVDVSWNGWAQWSECSEKCGDGVRRRKRSCYNKIDQTERSARLCSGPAEELGQCTIKGCPYWKEWSDWSGCSSAKTCGEGSNLRSRSCVNSDAELNCFGLANESRICNSLDCDSQISIIQSTSDSFGEGQLQMYHGMDWLPLCTKNWSTSNGDVACRQMGFAGGAYSSQFVQMDSAEEHLNVIFSCQGQETKLVSCPHGEWSVGACRSDSRILLKCLVDGRWSNWGSWSDCSVSCATGVSVRTRNCSAPPPKYGGQPCIGSAADSKPCSLPACPVDGVWMVWNAWSSCNVTCGGGGQTRVRFCIEPKYGGSYCAGAGIESKACGTEMCPVDGSWDKWGEWSSCSVSCGGGKRIRNRNCNPPKYGGKNCSSDGATSEDFCNDDPCKIDGQWSLWSRWLDCSVTCGSGTERRYRECSVPENGGNTCEGKPEEYRECNMEACPTPAEWSQWSAWGRCSATCGSSGLRARNRVCNQTSAGPGSLPCLQFNSSDEKKDCNRFSCSPAVKSCQEAFDRGLEENSFVQLALSGGSSTPVTVYCHSEAGNVSTIINSSYEGNQAVQFSPGVQRRNFKFVYSSNNVQMGLDNLKTLVYNSKECKQMVSWKCKNFPINSPTGVRIVFWKNQYSDEMAYWGDATAVASAGNSKPTTCSCGEKGTCAPYKCSCDRNLSTWNEDKGWLANKYDLPLTELVVTDTGFPQQEGNFSVGPLICN